MKKIMIQKITQNNWNFWTVNLIMRAKKLLTSRQIFRYAVLARTVTKSTDFSETRDSEWQRHQLGHMQVCTSLQTDNHANTPPLLFFTGQMPFLPPNQQRQSTEGTLTENQDFFRTNSQFQDFYGPEFFSFFGTLQDTWTPCRNKAEMLLDASSSPCNQSCGNSLCTLRLLTSSSAQWRLYIHTQYTENQQEKGFVPHYHSCTTTIITSTLSHTPV